MARILAAKSSLAEKGIDNALDEAQKVLEAAASGDGTLIDRGPLHYFTASEGEESESETEVGSEAGEGRGGNEGGGGNEEVSSPNPNPNPNPNPTPKGGHPETFVVVHLYEAHLPG